MKGPDFGSEVESQHDQDAVSGIGLPAEEVVVVNQTVNRPEDEEMKTRQAKKTCPGRVKNFCFTSMDWVRRVSVEPALLFIMISMGLTNGVSIQYVQFRIYQNYNITGGSGGPCSNQSANATAAEDAAASELNGFSVISGFVGGLPALFVTLIASAASDKVGRKLPLLLPVVGMFCNTCVFLVVSELSLSIMVLLISGVVFSFTGGYPLFFSGCSSYVADTSAKEDRTFLFALLFTMSLVGSGIAGIGAGYWIKGGSFSDPFWLAAALQALIILYLIFWLPETISTKSSSGQNPSNGSGNTGKSAVGSKMSAVWKGLMGICAVAEKGRRLWLGLALLVLFISLGVFGAINSVLFVRLLSRPFCWSSVLIGFFNASKPFINGLGLTLGSRFLTRCLKDYAVIQLGLVSTVGMIILICVSTDTYAMFFTTVVGSLHALPPVIIMAKMSKIIDPSLQGALFSLTGTTESLANLLGPFLLGMVYQGTLNTFPLTVFIVMIGLTVITMAIVGALMVMECRTQLEYQELLSDSEREDEADRSETQVNPVY